MFTLVDAPVQRGGGCPKTSDYLTLLTRSETFRAFEEGAKSFTTLKS